MQNDHIKEILEAFSGGNLSLPEALAKLTEKAYQDLGYAKIDQDRQNRKSFPESIYGENKTSEQLFEIVKAMYAGGSNVLATRLSPEKGETLVTQFPEGIFDSIARCFTLEKTPEAKRPGRLAIVCAGSSDLPVASEAKITAEFLGCEVDFIADVGIAGIHRLFAHLEVLEKARVCIVLAGMEGALPGVVAGLLACPVLAVPCSVGYGVGKGGFTALLSMLTSCAPGISVLNIDNGFGAACSAALILGKA